MAYITDNQLKAAVADSQGLSGPEALGEHWHRAAPRANRTAYNTIRTVLLGRGFTAAQIDAWDDRVDWSERLGVCQACWNVGKADEDRGEAFRREWESLLKELRETVVVVSGAVVDPSTAAASIAHGTYSDTSDIHTLDDEL